MLCDQGDVVLVNFDPGVGHEPHKYRPALVVSADDFNKRSSLVVVCPITSTDNGYPFHIYIECEDVKGFACVEALRAVDLQARHGRHVGAVGESEMGRILSLVGAVFNI
ncbi:MAG: type II toxin-antitoxin system PemK/MazF family toxin [Gordonibacter sp.]|uniref:type II toxin-antitoxin system PemK/MazF family toxin n=1 Tax=Gordonibacter sp. TaxID=1968902 RepID=UPI002FCAF709